MYGCQVAGDRLTKAAVAERALRLGDEHGLEAVTIRRLAQELGVTPMALYWHFKNKDELLETVFETGWSGFVARMRTVAESEGTLEEKVRGVTHVAFEAYRVDPRAVKVLILEIARSPASSRVNRQTSMASSGTVST